MIEIKHRDGLSKEDKRRFDIASRLEIVRWCPHIDYPRPLQTNLTTQANLTDVYKHERYDIPEQKEPREVSCRNFDGEQSDYRDHAWDSRWSHRDDAGGGEVQYRRDPQLSARYCYVQ